ncbi:hypothetical protein [Mycobacterium sp. NS-7484]|uniref:hypothetical protein n=1 Tax=Mycobacterium sp. NS-7484 TaxID=1834161 RepID=UPI0018E9BEAB|nr:hypothetical protein [Mycobacterium sp. NS-7484]
MEQREDGRPIPKDARETTEGQREFQHELDHQGEDPDGPGLHESRAQIADET